MTGSARSVRGFDVYGALDQCSDLIEQFGGHKYAAGLTMKIENLPAFKQRFEEIVRRSIGPEMLTPTIKIDQEIPLDVISKSFLSIIDQMEPFGPGNMKPVFVSTNLQAAKVNLLKEEHLKMTVVDGWSVSRTAA